MWPNILITCGVLLKVPHTSIFTFHYNACLVNGYPRENRNTFITLSPTTKSLATPLLSLTIIRDTINEMGQNVKMHKTLDRLATWGRPRPCLAKTFCRPINVSTVRTNTKVTIRPLGLVGHAQTYFRPINVFIARTNANTIIRTLVPLRHSPEQLTHLQSNLILQL